MSKIFLVTHFFARESACLRACRAFQSYEKKEGLENFAGCAVIISHDRWFLDRVCTHILAFEGDSQVYFFEGSFSEYEENKKKRLGGDMIPKRIKYKKLIR